MTGEERLNWLEQIEKDIYVNSLESTLADDMKSCAIHSAIEALKAEPCEDCVSREHLLSEIDELMQSPWFNNGKDFYDDTITHYGYVERKEAVEIVRDLCVKAEPSVTPKPTECEDAVSREAALKEMERYHDDCAKTSEYTRLGFETAMEVVKSLPPVTPKQRTGKWAKTGQSYVNPNRFRNYCCSECGWELDEHIRVEPHYCLNCGAKMEGESE